MKPVYYVAVIILAIGVNIPSSKALGEDIILELLEEIRNRMCHPIEKWGLPALDPFQIAHLEYAVDNKYLKDFTGSVTDFRFTGLSDFVINELQISTNPMKASVIDVSLPLTAINTVYTAKGSVAYIFNLAGDGNAEAYVEEFRVAMSWYLKTSLNLGIRNFNIVIKIGNLHIDFENLIEEPRINDFFHALVNELGLELLNDVWEIKHDDVEQLLEEKINGYIGQYTLSDIAAIIGAGDGNPIFGPDDPLPDCKETTSKKTDKLRFLFKN